MQKYGLALGIFVLAALFVSNFLFLPQAISPDLEKEVASIQSEPATITKLSEIKGPRIDEEAASISCADDSPVCPLAPKVITCASLPMETWVFLLAAYLGLLIFNLGFTFGKRQTVQWFWEALYTLLALAVWFQWDQCRANLWYPLYVLALGILIYLFYLYFFWETQKPISQEPE